MFMPSLVIKKKYVSKYLLFVYKCKVFLNGGAKNMHMYSRPSVARTLMARSLRLFRMPS